MRFPYAYYREYFNGRIHGEAVTSATLIITPQSIEGGEIDVASNSQLEVDTSLGDVTITGFMNGEPGQFIFIVNKTDGANKVIVKHNDTTVSQPILHFGDKDAYVESHEVLTLMSVDYGGSIQWISFNQGKTELGGGSEITPSLYLAESRNTGLYNAGVNLGITTLGITANGLTKMTFNQTVNSLVQHRFADGSTTAPSLSFISDPTSGFSRDITTGDILWIMNASVYGTFHVNGQLEIPNLIGTNIRQDAPINFKEISTENFSGINALDLVISDDPNDRINNAQTTGIYSKGDVKTDGEFVGTATSAEYADLAERYEASEVLEPGDVVEIGGAKEVQKATNPYKVFGIVSTDPAFKMNDKNQSDAIWPFIALTGRVPCKILGPVIKGDALILSETTGVAEVYQGEMSDLAPLQLIGYALETNMTTGIKTINIALRR